MRFHYTAVAILLGVSSSVPASAETVRELISYAIGCVMGRYNLAEPGSISADEGNGDFCASRYDDFPADDDGIVPITDTHWFDDDATVRLIEFLSIAWPKDHLDQNLEIMAESLGKKPGETPDQAIRRYFSRDFFKDHLTTYEQQPIYWLFSSGKEKAFECLVYMHRYNEGTLSRMRMEYVTPLLEKLSGRIEELDYEIEGTASTLRQRKGENEREILIRKRTELTAYDDKLLHYADQRISLDLDDGVEMNYGKFGDLLAEVKSVTGKK